jgi:hypothetical protein
VGEGIFRTPVHHGVQDKNVILDTRSFVTSPKEGRNVSAHADDEPICGRNGFPIVISS